MVMRTIILGSNSNATAEYYKKLELSPSTLLTSYNQNYTIAHTSVHDIPDLDELKNVLKDADQVYWAESPLSEFADPDSYHKFLYWLQDYNIQYKNVKNFSLIYLDPYGWKRHVPELTVDDIVFLGSSTTAGIGMPDVNTWYSTMIAKHFAKNSVNLAVSLHWAAVGNNDRTFDIYNQLDFCENQIVVVQIAPIDRVQWCDEDAKLKNLALRNIDISDHRAMLHVFNRKYLLYRLLNHVRAMVKLARARNLRLVLWFDNYKLDQEFLEEQMCFYEFPEVISKNVLQNYFLDLSEDNSHPGVKSNIFLAERIVTHIERLYS
jgi:hypothetical protein